MAQQVFSPGHAARTENRQGRQSNDDFRAQYTVSRIHDEYKIISPGSENNKLLQ
jgi:hypothetical protein